MSTFTPYLHPQGVDGEASPSLNRRRILVFAVAAVVVLALGSTWLIAFSSVLGVGTVTVRGTHVLGASQVRVAAGVVDGTPLARLDTAAVVRRVQQLPEVASARVSTSYPSTVTITVVERTPVGYVHVGQQDVLIDRTGTRYRTVPAAPKHIPDLVLPAGTDAAASRGTDHAVATVAATLSPELRAKVTSIQALAPDAITLVLRHGRVVRWGSASRNADKARILPVLLQHKNTQIDVTNPDQPFTR